ncbi:amino acid ABC transporter permease [Pandoraea soli]|uniref:Amino acid ABC transporter permease n=1 Tax=Pandoraea soli TaxID=2508293 RepID=A0ABY6W8F2_9BURK|nr:amino acid ABC transporter permease [Pandoraea soli]VVE38208.1 amino acid ABC transporter permease [Pandoraea soli]
MFDILHRYLLVFLVGGWPSGPIGGFALTLILAVLGLGLAFPVALVLGLARMSPWRVLRWPAFAWVYTLRGIPLLMIVFWAYYVIPLATGRTISAFHTALAAIVAYEAAFLSEIVRAGLLALPRGQAEAARASGLSYLQSLRHVLLPQALVNMIPSFVNQFVSTIKATSIVYVIGVQEVTFSAQQVNSMETTNALQVFLVLAGFYLLACASLSALARTLDRRIQRRRAAQ